MKLIEDRFEWRAADTLKPGDVYLLPRGVGYWVCLASIGADGETPFAVVLAEHGEASGDTIPRFVNLDALHPDMVARCPKAAIEPTVIEGAFILALPNDSALPGNLVLDGSGGAYLYMRQNNARYFDIAGGATLDRLSSRAAFPSWRVVSVDSAGKPLVLAEHRGS